MLPLPGGAGRLDPPSHPWPCPALGLSPALPPADLPRWSNEATPPPVRALSPRSLPSPLPERKPPLASPLLFLSQGMDKILQSMGRGQAITVTNDGATILKSIYVDNPAAKVGALG